MLFWGGDFLWNLIEVRPYWGKDLIEWTTDYRVCTVFAYKTSLKADSVGGRGSGALPFSDLFFWWLLFSPPSLLLFCGKKTSLQKFSIKNFSFFDVRLLSFLIKGRERAQACVAHQIKPILCRDRIPFGGVILCRDRIGGDMDKFDVRPPDPARFRFRFRFRFSWLWPKHLLLRHLWPGRMPRKCSCGKTPSFGMPGGRATHCKKSASSVVNAHAESVYPASVCQAAEPPIAKSARSRAWSTSRMMVNVVNAHAERRPPSVCHAAVPPIQI